MPIDAGYWAASTYLLVSIVAEACDSASSKMVPGPDPSIDASISLFEALLDFESNLPTYDV